MKISKKDYTINFAFMYLIHYISMAFVNAQRQTFLIELGYTLNQRSLIFSTIPAVTIALQLLVGVLSDKYKTIKKIIVYLAAGMSVFSFLFYRLDYQLYIFHFATAVISQSLLTSVTDLSDVWVLESDGPSSNKYGFIRAFGSAGWSIGSFLVAGVIARFGFPGLSVAILFLNVILLTVMFTISDDKSNRSMTEAKDAINLKDIIELFSDKKYLMAIAIVFFVNMAINMSGYIIVDKIIFLGGGVLTIAYRGVIAAGVEVPMMVMGDRVHKKLGSFFMILIGVLVHTVQFIGYFFAQTNTAILVITALQFISVPFFNIAIKYLLLDMSPERLKTTGQMSGPAIMNGVTGIIYPLIVAVLANTFNVSTPLLLAAVFGFIGISFTLMLYSKVRKDQ